MAEPRGFSGRLLHPLKLGFDATHNSQVHSAFKVFSGL